MPMPVSKDSMSRCDTPSMLYDTVRRPNAPYVPAKPAIDPAALTKDTIETTQQRLNREMMERFQNTSSRMPHQSFVVVAQVGKYLFLAIMLPPYICFFRIPYWLFMNALPLLFFNTKAQVLRVGRFFSELTKRVIDRMKGALQQLIGDSLKILNQHTKNFFGNVAQKVNLLAKGFRALAQVAQKNIDKTQSLWSQVSEKIINEFKKKLENIQYVQDKILQIAKSFANTLFYPLDIAEKYFFKPTSQWCMKCIVAVKDRVRNLLKGAQQSLKNFFQPLTSFSNRNIKRMYRFAQKGFQYAFYQMHSWLQPHISHIKMGLERVKEKLLRRILKTAVTVRTKIEEITSSMIEKMHPNMQVPMQIVVQFIGWAWWQTTKMVKAQWEYLKKGAASGKRAFIAIGSALANGVKGVSRQVRTLARGMLRGLYWLIRWLYLEIYKALKQLMSLPKKAFQRVVWFIKMTMRILGYCVYGLQIFIACVWVISGCGMILIRELAHEVGGWFTLRQ
jgi:hypothetical protein